MTEWIKKLLEILKGTINKTLKGKIVDNKAAKKELEDLKK